MFFIKQTSSWQGNNSLKKFLGPILSELNGQQVEDPAEVLAYLTAKLDFANRRFARCTAQKITHRFSYDPLKGPTQHITLREVGELSFYAILKTFAANADSPAPGLAPASTTACLFPRLSVHQPV